MARKRNEQLEGAVTAYVKAVNNANERKADLVNALKEAENDPFTTDEQRDNIRRLIGEE